MHSPLVPAQTVVGAVDEVLGQHRGKAAARCGEGELVAACNGLILSLG